MANLLTARAAVALVWFYQGFWCKVLGRASRQQTIAEMFPFVSTLAARRVLIALGVFECFIAAWVGSGIRPTEGAAAQTVLLISVNGCGLFWARRHISDPGGMLLQNFAFLVLAWLAAGNIGSYGA